MQRATALTSIERRVRGEQEFIADIAVPGTLHAALVHIDTARADLDSIETGAAQKVPGVVHVWTGADVIEFFGRMPRFGPIAMDQPVLAFEATRYHGEPVAVVLANSVRSARRAARMVRVQSTPRPGFVTVEAALAAESLHPPHPDEEGLAANLLGEWEYGWGDLISAERRSALVVENTYETGFAHHFAIETPGAIAIPDGDTLRVLSAVQHPFILRRVLSEMLARPEASIEVRAVDMGGSFGGKGYPKVGPLVAVLATMAARPVKLILSSEEAFFTTQREASEISVRTGFDGDGNILFQDIEADFLVGAYGDISSRVVSKSALHATGPYRTPASNIRARAIYTTTPPTTAFRGFGAPHLVNAIEGQFCQAAVQLGRDPIELRLQNIKSRGEPTVDHETPVDGDWAELIRIAAQEIGMDDAPSDPRVGKAVAFGMKSCIPATVSNALVQIREDGRVVASVGTSEMGQGAVITFARLIAAELGIEEDAVELEMGDTSRAPFDALTASSRSLVHMGNALCDACRSLKDHALEIVRSCVDQNADTVVTESNGLWIGNWRGGWPDLFALASTNWGSGLAEYGTFGAPADPDHPLGGPTPFFEAVATGVELSVEEATGMVTIHKLVHVTDVGKVHNLPRATGLDEGGVLMGVGLALSEQVHTDSDGRILNGSSLDYRIPSIDDIPAASVSRFQENADGPGPGGAKGMAEGGVLAVSAAIRDAIQDCSGVRITTLPITPERLWAEMQLGRHESS